MASNEKATSQYKATLKSMDTEEWFDLIFYRPIGYAWACLAKKLGVTPNAITIASIFLGMGAGVLFYFDNYYLNLLGILLLVWANSFDSADGQLARMTGQYSRLGRILDGLSGDLWFATIYVAICLREVVTSDFFEAHHWVIWVLAVVAGMCHAKQAAMADYYRQFHLFFVKGKEGSELENSFHLKRKLAALSWKKDFWQKLTMTFYTNYTVTQEKETPAMQAFRQKLAERYPGEVPEKLREEFRAASRPLMKYTNILSFNVRSWALIASILLKMPWLYFVFEITVMNAILLYMRHRHEAICRHFAPMI
ncbi:MAG: CDP-alcohol phosphatidyltransferase family protein [Muribaculaceae bacterium]|nr:CDP-alcohol phosphatidyltransferase family protein [Muribaculaceae bacterium]MDE6321933.1 CDP-alcohol phosphatidyltransferase family protein [Muribaculaceae bacterium]